MKSPPIIKLAAFLLLKVLAKPLPTTDSSVAILNITVPDLAATQGKVPYGGVNIAGFDFGCSTNNGCDPAGTNTDITDKLAQIAHFTSEGLNAFRLPVAWEYLATSPESLNPANLAVYDQLVQGCISSSAQLCIIDM
jgi:endoglucanase